MISVILPTRKRVEALTRSLNSLKNTAKDADSYEVVIAFDDDDLDSKKDIESAFPNIHTIVFPHVGYKYLHEYYNRLAAESRGDWLFVWNDDAIMETQGWDSLIEESDKNSCIGPTNIDKNGRIYQIEILFPIVPRKYFATLGHLSLNRHTDSWIYYIYHTLDRILRPDIRVRHDRPDLGGGNDDETYKSREYDVGSLFTEEMMKLQNTDLEKIRKELNGNPR